MKKLKSKVLSGVLTGALLLSGAMPVKAEEYEGLLPTPEEVFKAHMEEPEEVFKEELSKDYYMGDINGDNQTDLRDAQEILHSIICKTSTDNHTNLMADMDEDGDITLMDAKAVFETALGMKEEEIVTVVQKDGGMSWINEYEKDFYGDSNEMYDRMEFIDSEEELLSFANRYDQKDLILEKYQGTMGEQILLTMRTEVNADTIDGANFYMIERNNNIRIQISDDRTPDAEKIYYLNWIVSINKNVPKNKITLTLDSSEVIGKVDIVCTKYLNWTNEEKETVSFSKVTPYGHLIRNTKELKLYRQFLENTFDLTELGDEWKSYTNHMQSGFFRNHAYVVFTYHNRLGDIAYRVTDLKCEEGVLNVQLQFFIPPSPVPGFTSGTYSVFVNIPPELAAQADSVVLDVVKE